MTGHAWDHFLLFAVQEINAGMHNHDDDTRLPLLDYDILYANPTGLYVAGEAQRQFMEHVDDCDVFIGPAWSSQLAAMGELASLWQTPVVTGGATSPAFAGPNFNYVSRSIPSDQGLLDAFVELIVEYDISHVNIVLYNDEYGRSIAQGLVTRSAGLFQIQTLQTLGAETTDQTLDALLHTLMDSPTQATFLSMTVLPLTDFLNAAGRKGMHDYHLWLSPHVTQIVQDLQPPAAGAWGLAYGPDLTATDALAQRYLAKDPAPHVALQAMYPDAAWGDDESAYEELSLWGAYAYDAVLVAAHGMAAAVANATSSNATMNNITGPQLLQAIRSVTVTKGSNTGAISMDPVTGDRLGARIPLFYTTLNGTSEQFAMYEAGQVTFLKDPLWPGGSTTRPPNLVQINDGTVVVTNSSSPNMLVLWITFPIVLVIVLVLVVLVLRTRSAVRDVRRAPKVPPCCLLFTDIQASSTLWGLVPAEMSHAIDTHHAVVRACLQAHGAYEVKTIGDSFMIACTDPDTAIRLAMDLQSRLYDAHWNPAIDETYKEMLEPSLDDPAVWRGLRVRASVHFGSPNIDMDEVTKGYDYYGSMVNEAARMEGLAHGGQTVVSQALMDALKDPPTDAEMTCLGEYPLRGCPGEVQLWNVVPKRFSTRQFPPLRTGDVEHNTDDEAGEWEGHDFNVSEAFETSTVSTVGVNYVEQAHWMKTLFSAFQPSKRKDLTHQFCAAWRVRSEDQLARRISKVDHARKRLERGGSLRHLQNDEGMEFSSQAFSREDLMARLGAGRRNGTAASLPQLRESLREAFTEEVSRKSLHMSSSSMENVVQVEENNEEDQKSNKNE